ncbi:MAG: protein-L-isoaspartate(D-aspartate) O-methyltransferase [Gammaproteobacteria bacterium]|nr:protein-L-isoaspartate(D-aspartate) O-methyltransferase [Gammaproteobacteria bacterium]
MIERINDRSIPNLPWRALLLLCAFTATAAAADFSRERERLMEEVRRDIAQLPEMLDRPRLDPAVDAAMARVPRHEFVPAEARRRAYANRPLPIGHGQTISQPLIVALMTDLLDIDRDSRVFELGTGSGYQAAVLAEIVDHVYTVEIIPELGERARATLRETGYDNVTVKVGDGYHGWPEHAPFDAIIVTAAGDHIPPPLIEQLKPGGRMVIPVGNRYATQQLMVVTKEENGSVRTRSVLPVRFVPLTGDH